MTANNNNNDNWITPKQASANFNIQLRRIYRWIETSKVSTQGEKGNILVSSSDIQKMLQRERANAVVSEVIGRQDDTAKATRRDMGNAIATNFVALDTQRDKLQSQLTEAQESRRQDARLIGELTGKLEAVERQMEGMKGRESVLTRLIIGLVAALVILAVIVAIVAVIIR